MAGFDIGQFYQPGSISLSSLVGDYASALPTLLQLQQQYAPQYTAADLALQKTYLPQYNDLYQGEMSRLYPQTYGLQEALATQANQGMGGMPENLKDIYRNELKANIDPNVGSPIASDYISTNLVKLGEQYKQNYQNLGLSLLGKYPGVSQQAYSPQLTSNFDMAQAGSLGLGAYQAYNNALNQSYYVAPKSSSKSNWGSMIGGGLGAAAGAYYGGPTGAGIGYSLGSRLGGSF